MFKSLVLVACLACIGSVLTSPAYTTKYDNVDLDEILANDRLFTFYYKCLMDQGPCSPDAAELKKYLPDAIETECSGCSDKQKEGSKKVFKFLIEKKPEEWKALEGKYDPSGSYKTRYEARHSEELKSLEKGTA
ncbi:hypothetical protein M8J75_013611 [Diaphorina citri]|nr:hypothetical protein M8J75_013611 [Diaphorina citri]KAI5739197.1 hypothetical protein M8J77_016210 [Diaphorina citri]